MISLFFLVPSSMLSTVSALSAQNIGAGKHERASQTLACATTIAVSYGIVVSILMQFAGSTAVGLFSSDADVIRLGTQYLHSYIWDCIFAGIHFCFSGYFCAYGQSGISFCTTSFPCCVPAFRWPTWHRNTFRTTCSPWDVPLRLVPCCLW